MIYQDIPKPAPPASHPLPFYNTSHDHTHASTLVLNYTSTTHHLYRSGVKSLPKDIDRSRGSKPPPPGARKQATNLPTYLPITRSYLRTPQRREWGATLTWA